MSGIALRHKPLISLSSPLHPFPIIIPFLSLQVNGETCSYYNYCTDPSPNSTGLLLIIQNLLFSTVVYENLLVCRVHSSNTALTRVTLRVCAPLYILCASMLAY